MFPWYITKVALAIVILVGLASLAASVYFFVIAGVHGERLDGRSHYLGGISFLGAVKSAGQLGWRMNKVRSTFISVALFAAESDAPLP